jgi:hypothetical protein
MSTTLLDLSIELILEIADHLSPKDYVSLSSSCKSMRDVLKLNLNKKKKEQRRNVSRNLQGNT